VRARSDAVGAAGSSQQRPGRGEGSQIAVIGKAMAVLEVLLALPSGATPSQIAERTGTNRSTAFRLLASLESAGLVDRDADGGRYRLGLGLLRFGDAVRRRLDLVELAEPALVRLRDAVRQSVYLSVRVEWEAVCLHRLAGPEVDVLAWQVGARLPLHVGAGPRALLAAMPDAELERWLRAGGERTTLRGPMSEADLRRVVEETRARGWSLNREDLTAGVASLGAVVRDGAGSPVAAVSIAGLASHYGDAQLPALADAVLAAAAAIAATLAR